MTAQAAAVATGGDSALVRSLRDGDERAFATLLEQHHAALVRVANLYVRNRAVAEEVAQETWLGVIRGIDRFEGRSSLKTWIFRILTNTARSRAERERRSTPFSALAGPEGADGSPVDLDRFYAPDTPGLGGHWAAPPSSWDELPESSLLSGETFEQVRAAIELLPPTQRRVITLRDVEGWSAAEVCELLGLSEANQRVLLHRARSRVRRVLEAYLD